MKSLLGVVVLSLSLFACGGLEGPPGPAGPKGSDGAGIKSIYTCNGTRTFGSQTLFFNSARYDFADESVMTTCIVNDALTSYSNTFLYRDYNPGASTGSCLVVYDLDTPSEGVFKFGISKTGSGTVGYEDNGSNFNAAGVQMTCTRR